MAQRRKRTSTGFFVIAVLLALLGAGLFYWASTITFDPAVDSGAGELKRRLAEVAAWIWTGAGALGGVAVALRFLGK